MSWIGVGTTVIGGALQYKGQKDAAKAAEKGANQAGAVQQAALNQTRQDFQPYMQLGNEGASGLQRLMADPNSIAENGAYQWRLGQGIQALDRSAAARGGLFGGGHSADLMRYGQGEASQEYGNEWNRFAGLSNMGQNTASALGNLGQGFASNQGNALMGAADARAAGYANTGNILSQGAYAAGGAINDWWQNRQAQRQPSYNLAQPQSTWGQQASTGAGSLYNFGNNPGWRD